MHKTASEKIIGNDYLKEGDFHTTIIKWDCHIESLETVLVRSPITWGAGHGHNGAGVRDIESDD